MPKILGLYQTIKSKGLGKQRNYHESAAVSEVILKSEAATNEEVIQMNPGEEK